LREGANTSGAGCRSINWKAKALLQRCLSRCPLGLQVNYLLQRYVQRSLPIDERAMREVAELAAAHLEALRDHLPKPPQQAVCVEIGAGTDLALPLLLYSQGVNRQITIDIAVLARRVLVNSAIASLRSLDLPLRRPPAAMIGRCENLRGALRAHYGIDYLAPRDARHTGLPSNSIDFIHSTSTMEHIPPADLRLILGECRRLLAPAGLVSLYIDYRDHYSYADRGISVYNFLQYSDAAWSRFNSSLQYQNRLRHPDYLELAGKCGFRILSERRVAPSDTDRRLLGRLELDARFRRYDCEDLAVQGAHLVMAAKPGC
jgi:SAM-dependent methyltransferase